MCNHQETFNDDEFDYNIADLFKKYIELNKNKGNKKDMLELFGEFRDLIKKEAEK